MNKSATEPQKSNVGGGQKAQPKMAADASAGVSKRDSVKPAGMSFSDWKKQKEAEERKHVKGNPLAPPPPIPNTLMSIEVELPMGQSFCDGSTRGSNNSLPLYQRKGHPQRNNMANMNDWNLNTMSRNGRNMNSWNNGNMNGMNMNTRNMNGMNMNNRNFNMDLNNRNFNMHMNAMHMNAMHMNMGMNNRNMNMSMNGMSTNRNNMNNINNERWGANNRNRMLPYNREANNQYSNRSTNNQRTGGFKRLDRHSNKRNFTFKPQSAVKQASKPEVAPKSPSPDRPPPPERIYIRTKDMVRPLMPPPIIALTPELKEEKQRAWREYRVAMKPFKNREFANAKRIVQRLGKKDPSELDEKDRSKLEKAQKDVEDHKKMLNEKAALRDRVAAGEIAKGRAYPIRQGGENGKRAHIYEIATPRPYAYHHPTPATNGGKMGAAQANVNWNIKSSFVSGGIMQTH